MNNTFESLCIPEPGSMIFTLASPYILPISVLGVIFNIFVLMVYCLHKKACTVAEIYLTNRVGADLVLVYSLPFWADYVANDYNWPFSEIFCKLVTSIMKMNEFCGIYFLVLVSADCYVALAHPLTYKRMSRPFYAKLGCLIVWSLGLVFVLPSFIYRKLFLLQSNLTVCGLHYTHSQYLMSEVRTVMSSVIIPVSIISFCTLRIIRALRNRNTRRTEQTTTTLILIILLAFLICWGPFHVSRILNVFKTIGILRCDIMLIMYNHISMYLAFFNSVLNPFLYITVGKSFRKRAKELLKQCGNLATETASHAHSRQVEI